MTIHVVDVYYTMTIHVVDVYYTMTIHVVDVYYTIIYTCSRCILYYDIVVYIR